MSSRYVHKVIFKMQRLVPNSKYANCKTHSCSHIQNAYNGLRKGEEQNSTTWKTLIYLCFSGFEAGTKSSKLSSISSVQHKIR